MGDSLTVKLAALTRAFPVRIWVPQPICLLTPVVCTTENLCVSPVSVWSPMPVHEIDPSATSPEVVVLTIGAAVAVLYACWKSNPESRRLRRLVTWLREYYAERWTGLPWVSRTINFVGGVEHLRRNGLSEDAEFMGLYRETKRGGGIKIAALVVGMALIGAVLLGVRYPGWSWQASYSAPARPSIALPSPSPSPIKRPVSTG